MDLYEPIPEDDDSNDGLPPYASARTHRLNLYGSFADYAASLAADRREWEMDYYGEPD